MACVIATSRSRRRVAGDRESPTNGLGVAYGIERSERQTATTDGRECRIMGDKSPKKDNAKKPSKSLKEKRADKQSKRDEKRPGFGH
jgi:hypothetical protein